MSQWPQISLGEIFDIARGGSPRPIDNFITDAEDGVNWISISDATESAKYINSTKKKIIKEGVSRSRMVHPGDFLLTNSMSFGRPYIMNTSGCIHDGWLVLSKRTENVDQDYFFHLLGSDTTYRKFKALAAGAVVKNLNIDLVKSVTVPLPPLEEQKRIAAILDKADSLRRKRQQAIRLADDFLRAVFLDMFGDPVTNPRGWPIEKLRSVTTKITDGTHKSPPMAAAGIPYVTAKHIKQEGVRFDLAPTYISESDHREIYSRCDPTLGDVLYIKDGATTGIACKNNLPGEFSLLSSVALIRPNRDRLRSEYLVELLNNEKFKTALTGDMAGAAIKRFTLSKIGDFKLPIPLIEKQNEFGTIAEKVKTLQIKLRDELKANQALFSAIQSQFF